MSGLFQSGPRHHHRHKRRTFADRLIHGIKRIFRKKSEGVDEFTRTSKFFKPETGPSISGLTQINDLEKPGSIFSGERRHRIHRHHKRRTLKQYIQHLQDTWEERRERQQKEKFKRRMRRKHRKREKKEERILFIRKFFPSYKQPKRTSFETVEQPIEQDISHSKTHYYIYAANSVLAYISAYIFCYFLYQITVLLAASLWRLDSVLFYYDLAFNDYSPLWTRLNIIFITFTGPLISLVMAIVVYRFLVLSHRTRGLTKLFFLWLSFHGYNLFFGAFASGVSFDEGFGYVANWLFMNVVSKFLLSMVFLAILGFIGYYASPRFQETSNSLYRIRKENRTFYLLSVAVIPWLVGSILILLIKMPNNLPYDTGILLTMMFAVIPVLLNFRGKPVMNIDREKRRKTQVNWAFILIFLILVTIYRVGLNSGLHFMITFKISVNISPL